MDKQKKAFIVYATEDYDLTQNFVDQFSIHNYELEILYDKNPYSNTIDDQLIGYAKDCDIAVILASPRLMAPFHYSNQKEIPLLIERRKKGEIMIVGIWLKDTDVTKWNETGDINFFQGRISEYRFSKQEGPYAAKFNSGFMVYQLLDERDRSTYHKHLKKWIQSLKKETSKKQNEPKIPPKSSAEKKEPLNKKYPELHLRSFLATNRIIMKMLAQKFLSYIEMRLSESEKYWVDSGFVPPKEEESYAYWFFLQQSNFYEAVSDQASSKNEYGFLEKVNHFLSKIETRNNLLIDLCGEETENDLFSHLVHSNEQIGRYRAKLILNPEEEILRLKSNFISECNELWMVLRDLGQEAFNSTNQN